MTTICAECEHLHPDGLKNWPGRWMCLKHPRVEGFGFVTNTEWDSFPPYLYCHNVNGGECPLFEPKRTATEG